MPIESIVVSCFIVVMFSTFAIALAYGEYQTRNLKRASDASVSPQAEETRWLKAA